MMGRPVLTRNAIDAHQSALSTQDVIWSPLFDYQTYGTQGNTQFTFFTSPIGQGTTSAPGATGSKTLADTNLTAAGQLTKGNAFFMTGLETLLFPGAASTFGPGEGAVAETKTGQFCNDIYAVGKGGTINFTVGSDRSYIKDGPLNMFPPVTRLAISAAIATSLGSTTAAAVIDQIDYAAWGGEPYSMVPIYIDANQGFQAVMQFPVAIAPPSAVAPRIGLRARGYLIRNAQ
jgi:hypothetical protein